MKKQRDRIRYLTTRRRADGRVAYYWQPNKAMRDAGWTVRPLGHNAEAATTAALQANQELDAWRAGKAPATDGTPPPPPPVPERHTFAHLVKAYRASRHYPTNPKTARSYEVNLKALLLWAGDAPITSITPPSVQALMEAHRATPHHAAALVRMLSILFNKGRLLGLTTDNPAARAGIRQPPPRHQTWTDEAVETCVAVADRTGMPSVGTAIMISMEIAQRQTDCLAMPKSRYQNGEFQFRQSKRGALIAVPATQRLRARLAAMPKTNSTTIIVNEKTGAPYTEQQFQTAFIRVRKLALQESDSLQGLQYRDLRRTGVCLLAIAACTIAQIAAVSGHKINTVTTILETYLPRMGVVAAAAIAKLDEYRQNQTEIQSQEALDFHPINTN